MPTAKLISGYTGSKTCIDLLRARLDQCLSNHGFCRDTSTSVLPTRVLEISTSANGLLGVRLIETNNQVGRYVCLSHRWIEGHTITTTTANINDRRTWVPRDEMPKTFLEAIWLAHTLGFTYIWIDSLAINQDPESGDWLIEAPKMAQYYQNATLTISAAEATDGLFYKSADNDQVMWKVVPPEQYNQPSYNIYLRRPLSHDNSALHHRGWVFQEHLLSPRIAHFGKELIWECAELTACECGRLPLPNKGGRDALRDAWGIGSVVSTYGRKQGHMMALTNARPETRYYITPQPVLVKPNPDSPKTGVEISSWILTQRQMKESDAMAEFFDGSSTDVRMSPADPRQDEDSYELDEQPIILQTAVMRRNDNEEALGPSSPRKPLPDSVGEDDEGTTQTSPTASAGSSGSSEAGMIRVTPPTSLLHSRWLDIIAHYTRRRLTFGSDILPALSGLSKQFQPHMNCDYYAGLWKDTLVMDLLWRSRNARDHPRPTEWRAPSWSWASTTAAVDYYHLLMVFELDSLTFRYSISDSYIKVIEVDCVPLQGEDSTMRLQSAKLTLIGVLFAVALDREKDVPEARVPKPSNFTAEEIESVRETMEQAISLPKLAIPEDDIKYFPLARCMDDQQETAWLTNETGFTFLLKKDQALVREEFDVWWDCKLDDDVRVKDSGELETFVCLLIAKHESEMDTAFFSLLLKPMDEPHTYERIGLMRHEIMIECEDASLITIV